MNPEELKYQGVVVDFSGADEDKICLAAIPEPEDNERTCAVCLMPVPRDEYEKHMEGHGYETLHIGHVEDDYPYEYIHDCGKPAFYLKRIPRREEVIDPEDAINTDGSHPQFGEEITCSSCGETLIGVPLISNIRKRDD